MLYQRILKEKQRIQGQIVKLQEQISMLPEGKLVCCGNGKDVKWYKSNGHSKVYIPKKQRALAEQLAEKKYLSYVLEELEHEKQVLDFYLKHHKFHSRKIEDLLINHSCYQELLTTHFLSQSQEISEWLNSSYEHNMSHPEYLIHKTCTGECVRSKSEAMISLFLYTNQIPFRYECALYLGETIVYPDFTIRHPQTGEIYYWEHFGRMDDFSYSQNACSKLQLYTAHGIIPSIHLITTYETQGKPLNTEEIEKIIEHYFL